MYHSKRGGDADEAQRFPCGRTIEQDDVEPAPAHILVDVEQKADLLHARQDGEFLGKHLIQARGVQQPGKIVVDLAPVAADFLLDVHLLDPEVVGDLERTTLVAVEQLFIEIENVRQAVRHVQGHDEGPFAHFRRAHAGSGRHGGLSDPAFTRKKDNSQTKTPGKNGSSRWEPSLIYSPFDLALQASLQSILLLSSAHIQKTPIPHRTLIQRL